MEKELLIEFLTNGGLTIPRLLIENYSELGLNEEQCLMVIHIYSFIKEGNTFPTPDELARRMSCDSSQCSNHLRMLVQSGFLEIKQEKDRSVYTESYSLDPLWERLISLKFLTKNTETKMEQEDALYTIFEKEFGRPLSPMECESLTMWMDQDQHSPEMITAALREAVISGKLNFRYIDRILFDWKKSGVRTLAQAKSHGEKIRGRYTATSSKKPSDKPNHRQTKIPMYNWLDN
ncbi:DNA replication protein [Pullulanibacillus pueri]|nr:DNA replication protein [Pullulanibacillus pueri]